VTRDGASLTVLNEAACWLMHLRDESVAEADVAAWLAWCNADPENLRVFESIERFYDQLRALPADERHAFFGSLQEPVCNAAACAPRADLSQSVGSALRVKLEDIPDSGCKIVALRDGLRVAIFRVGCRVAAINNRCPHAGGSLGDGIFDGTTVNCPRHGFRVDVWRGVGNAGKPVQRFPVRVLGDEAAIDVADTTPRPGRWPT
jgi:nitrite reductase (NADH) small subunit